MDWNLLGHDWAVALLRRHIANQNLRHAYLFTGPSGVGRRTLALRFGQALNCIHPLETAIPCLQCKDCRQIDKMQHPDLAIVQSERTGATLKVEQVRDMQHGIALAAYQAKYRVALFLRFEEANDSAANALLKTLEEPPKDVILILTADHADSLLPTIVSRCEVMNLRPLPVAELSAGLITHLNLAPEQANLLAHISNGCPGIAIQYSRQPKLLEHRRQILEDHMQLLKTGYLERFKYAEALSKDRDKDNILGILGVWLSFWRDVMLYASGCSAELSNPDYLEDIQRLSTRCELRNLQRFIDSVRATKKLLLRNINLRLALEVLLLDLPHLHNA
jgi:DNA polymerase-3 subunit delta'